MASKRELEEALSLCAFSLKHALLSVPDSLIDYLEDGDLRGKCSPEIAQIFEERGKQWVKEHKKGKKR